ncbi:MAG: bifunctional (p)ppGpp synthetase/guanosine-3',5'-bis(diphosphate) 3'-pyrophosphohydrolase [Acidobacteria bacterium]|nr:bifunctional (p)ppGpp synthetase/guanosine-3',5'-bis(diphosphate) 3'-pyrophosphohydrolase [Acidobacteriota bacterium]
MSITSERLARGLTLAERLHREQMRKASSTPYVSHLLAVAALTLEYGGNEDQAIAALLHDAAEDQGGVTTLEMIRADFGDVVANIVAGCSDTFETPKPAWRARKENFLSDLESIDLEVLLVVAADKLHNATTMLEGYRAMGAELWLRFAGSRDQQLWYLESVAEICVRRLEGDPLRLADRLSRVVTQLEEKTRIS